MRPLRPRKPRSTDDPPPVRGVTLWNKLLKDRKILIEAPIDESLANTVIAQILFLTKEDPRRPIQLFVSSPGGYVIDALAIHDTVRANPTPIRTHCHGDAHGVAAMIVAAGQRGYRTCSSTARFRMVPIGGAEKVPGELDPAKKAVVKVFAALTGQEPAQVDQDMTNERLMQAKDALAYGLVDQIVIEPPQL